MTPPLPLIEKRILGGLPVTAIQAGGQRLDGGAMFGVVPKPLWQRYIPADDRNRIQLGMRCLLIEHPSGLILIDTGAGNKEAAKFKDIYGIENEGADGRTALEDGLREIGARPEDVSIVINTHLHFDHAGGNTYTDESGAIKPSFPNARYIIRRGEYDFATHTNERTAASYFERNFMPVVALGRVEHGADVRAHGGQVGEEPQAHVAEDAPAVVERERGGEAEEGDFHVRREETRLSGHASDAAP